MMYDRAHTSIAQSPRALGRQEEFISRIYLRGWLGNATTTLACPDKTSGGETKTSVVYTFTKRVGVPSSSTSIRTVYIFTQTISKHRCTANDNNNKVSTVSRPVRRAPSNVVSVRHRIGTTRGFRRTRILAAYSSRDEQPFTEDFSGSRYWRASTVEINNQISHAHFFFLRE